MKFDKNHQRKKSLTIEELMKLDAEREQIIDNVLSDKKEFCPKCGGELYLSPPDDFNERHPGVYCKECEFSILIDFFEI